MTMRRFGGLVTVLTLASIAGAQTTSPSATRPAPARVTYENPEPDRYLFEDQIKPGMKGYGLTVMNGPKIEKFSIEVIDVVQNITPGTNAIIVRCSGLNLEHSGIIAGMSGSPCYIDGKMIGAIAFGWRLSKDPIGGVQPIRQMLRIQPSASAPFGTSAAGQRWARGSHDPFAATAARTAGWQKLSAHLATKTHAVDQPDLPGDSGLVRLAAPLMASGLSAQSMSLLQESLHDTGLMPVAGGSMTAPFGGARKSPLGGAADIKPADLKLAPGSAVAIPILTGDADMSAVGTVTEVRDNKVYAFGHAMLSDGATRLPLATSYIYTVLPSIMQSFKMGASYETVGTLVTDESTGILGLIGDKPTTVPISINVKHTDGSVDRTYHYNLTPHPRLTPMIASVALTETITGQRQLPKQSTIRLTGSMKFAGATIQLDSISTADTFNLQEYLLPLAMLTDNPYRNLDLEGIELSAVVEPANKAVQIQSIVVPRTLVKPGDSVQVLIELEQYQGKRKQVSMSVKVPDNTPDGTYTLAVGSSMMTMSSESDYFPQRYQPENIESLTAALQRLLAYRHDRLYAMLVTDVHGIARRGREMRHLPASKIDLFSSAKRRDSFPLFNETRTELAVDGVIIDNGETFQITVSRDMNRRYGEGTSSGGGMSPGGIGGGGFPRPSVGPHDSPFGE